MAILAAAILDFIQQLKKRSKGWTYEPLVVTDDRKLTNNNCVTVKERSNNHTSPTQFYIDNPPTGISTLVKAKTKGYLRIIEFRLMPGPTAKLVLRYWRANGWLQNQTALGGTLGSYSPRRPLVQQRDGETNYKVFIMNRVTKRRYRNKKDRSIIHRDVIDLTTMESFDNVADLAVLTLDKSTKKTHGCEKLSENNNMAVILDGRNFMYGHGHRRGLKYEIVYG